MHFLSYIWNPIPKSKFISAYLQFLLTSNIFFVLIISLHRKHQLRIHYYLSREMAALRNENVSCTNPFYTTENNILLFLFTLLRNRRFHWISIRRNEEQVNILYIVFCLFYIMCVTNPTAWQLLASLYRMFSFCNVTFLFLIFISK